MLVASAESSIGRSCEHLFVSWRPPDPWSYSHLLGWYLGDGCISRVRGTFQLIVTCDAIYPELIEDCKAAVYLVTLPRHVYVRPHRVHRSVRIEATWKRWPEVFPQHGPGRKHNRPIVLEDWQQRIVDAHPWAFLRGLLHSDGCRCVNRFTTRLPSGRVAEYAYPRWFFSNLSADIRGLFCATCDTLGVRWTQSNHRNISISHRHSVALVDAEVGPKR
jgi:hypothetical protein